MKFFKKILRSAVPALIAGMLLAGTALSSAADTNITAIDKNTLIEGTVSAQGDVHMYKFTAPEDGYINLIFNSKAANPDRHPFTVKIYKGSMDHLYSKYEGGSNDFKPVGAKKGTDFFISVDMFHDISRNTAFDLMVKYFDADNWENENNDDKTNARNIIVNNEYNGSVRGFSGSEYGEADSDVFVFTAPARGYFTVELKHADAAEKGEYVMDITDVNGNKLLEEAVGSYLGTPRFSAAQGNKFYITVTNGFLSADDEVYKLKVNFTQTDLFELEDNSVVANSTPITLGKQYRGVAGNFPSPKNGDIDGYKFKVERFSKVTLDLKNVYSSNKDIFYAKLYNASGDEYDLIDRQYSGKVTVNLAKGTYYLSIYCYGSDPVDYKFKLSVKPVKTKKPEFKSIKFEKITGNKYAVDSTEIYQKGPAHSYYMISVSNNKKMKNSKSIKYIDDDNGKTFNLKAKKTVYVTVCDCYKDAFGKVIKGPASKVKAVNIK